MIERLYHRIPQQKHHHDHAIMDWFIDNGPENEWSPKAKQDKVLLK
jgi:hypothetical protein